MGNNIENQRDLSGVTNLNKASKDFRSYVNKEKIESKENQRMTSDYITDDDMDC